jgi:hypothetical protein
LRVTGERRVSFVLLLRHETRTPELEAVTAVRDVIRAAPHIALAAPMLPGAELTGA